MATITAPTPKSGSRAALAAEIWHRLPVETWVLGCAVLLCIGLAFASPYFLTSGNVFNIMRQVSIDAIVAYGELFTIITAGIDLSVGSVLGFTGVAFAMLLANGVSLVIAAPITLALGLAIGIVNGLAVDKLGIPAFIVTLAGLQAYRGLTMLVSGGMTVAGLPDSLGNFANSSILGIPTMFVVMLAFAAASQFLLGATRLGRYMYALGSNIEAARRVGVNVTGVTLAAYGLASLFAAVGGMLLVARLTMGNPERRHGCGTSGDRRRGRRRRQPVRRTRDHWRLLHRRDPVHHHRQRRKLAWRQSLLADGDRGPAHRRRGLPRQRAEATRARTVDG